MIKRLITASFAALVLLAGAVIGLQTWREPGSQFKAAPVADRARQLARGAYLVKAGNCMACHTVAGSAPFAGGRAIDTPFGRIHTSNITPDRGTGIGAWSADDFWRAIHNGKSRDGSFLYPAFPYTSYTKVVREDADAMYAYLMRQQPVRQANLPHTLRFPYNQRVLLAFWRTLYFTPGQYRSDPQRSALWNRGAYLVQGVGHCAACHTGRDALGGPLGARELGGGALPGAGWEAAALAGHGLGQSNARELAGLLKTGVSARGAVYGPMAEVVGASLQHLSDGDSLAMATYLKALPPGPPVRTEQARPVAADAKAVLARGAALYRQHCAACHQEDGRGRAAAWPALAGKRSLGAGSAANPILLVLNGGFAPSTAGNPRPYGMPPFGHVMNDADVAAVVSHLRSSWGNGGALVSAREVARLRGVPER